MPQLLSEASMNIWYFPFDGQFQTLLYKLKENLASLKDEDN